MKQYKLSVSILLFFIAFQIISAQNMLKKVMSDPPKILIDQFMDELSPGAKYVSPGLFDSSQPFYEVFSKDNNQFLGTIDGDLYIRNQDSDDYYKRIKPKDSWYWHIDNAMWSTNGKYIIAKQVNDDSVPTIKLTRKNPQDVSYKTYSRAGEKIPVHQFYIINTETWETTAVKQKTDYPYVHVMGWHANNSSVFMLESDRLLKEIKLLNVDVNTGDRSLILKEKSDTYLIGLNLLQGYSRRLLNQDLITFLHDREQFIWLSERSGFYQLYLYDYDGNVIRKLTNGIFESIVDINLESDWLYYLSYDDPSSPYSLQVYRTSLSGEKIQKISDINHIEDAFVSKEKDSLYILQSGLPALLQIEAFSMDGKYLETYWKGNVSLLEEDYFNAEYAQVKDADNEHMIETLLLKPEDFDPNKKYPVVEYIYGGNFTNEVIRSLISQNLWEMQDLSNRGVIVVFIDGRGTPKRGQAFRDFSYGRFGQVEIRDHVAAIQQLSDNRPYMDMNKIGIIGHSWGGHFALRALLEAPEFYKVGHINAPGFDPVDFRVPIEVFMGCLPQDCPEAYEKSNISKKLINIKASLMIVHGTADDDVPIEESYKLVAELKELNYSNYTFIEYQGFNHIVMRHPEWKSTMIDYFINEFNKL